MLVQINGREGPGRPERGVGKFRARFSHAFCVAEWLIFEFKAVSRAFVSSWNEEEEIDAASWRTREYESVLRNYVALEFDRSMGKFNLSAGITVVCFLLGIAFGLNSKNSHFSPSTQAQESLDERSSPMVVLYVSEQCDHDFELDLMDIVVSMGLDRVMNDTKFYTVPKSVMCATNSSRTSTFLEMVKDPKSRFIVGSIEPSLCSVGQSLAQLHNITLVTWSCSEIHGDSLNLVNILPSKRTILNAIVNIVSTIRWRSISIITNSDENWWSDLAFRLGLALKKLNRTIIKNFILLNKQDTQESIERQLSKLKQTITSGVILCLPVYEEFTQRIIKMIDTRNFLEHPQSSLMMIDMFTGLPILSFNYSISSSLKLQRNGTDKNYHSYNQFAPSSPESSESNLSSQSERRSELHRNHSSQLPNSFFKNQSNAQKIAHPNEKLSMLHLGNSSRVKIEVAAAGPEDKQSLTSVKLNGNQTELNSNNSYFPLHRHSGYRVSKKMGDNLLVFTLSDYFFHRSSKNEMEYLFKSSLEVVKNSTKFIENQKFHFLLADVLNFSTNNPISRIAWRPVLDISCNFKNCTERNNSQFKTEFLIPNASSWIRQKSSWVYDGSVGDMCDDFTSCPDDDDELMFDEQYGTLVMGVLLTSAIFIGLLFVCCFVRNSSFCQDCGTLPCLVSFSATSLKHIKLMEVQFSAVGTVVETLNHLTSDSLFKGTGVMKEMPGAVRTYCDCHDVDMRQYLKSKTAKGPVKILLTPADFVFPQVQDTGGVDSGIESMLCCWLTQLQEFGGPSMKEKPDLLKGSVLSLKSQQTQQQRKNSTSSLSLSRPFVIDSRARYNGDLVQLKELPMQGGNFELKSKAMDILVSLHGLRHENLNPLIGCLTDPARPALVWEWCSRGSLEDVLIQDEIKLDWTFRLSLLTDLVRGMRYLHTCPYRVHGALTSRNCVIDARWVLKITDYSLTTFYEAQNITSPEKSARDLLWTAPELLRSPMNAKRGTQSGDVYSFAIIMQEVVVRGEPFCMLSLTPEDIIEKVKRPPPLIRPSVSKGAAPPEAINIMRQCWAEQPDKRPDFNGIFDLFKTLNHGRKANFVDTMFQMLEKYSNNLEDLIRDRTEQLDMEKKKTEQLLNRMLPSTVAEKLKLGMPVDPEDFEEVTIYFSDIVGFTTISAYSTPFEVVDLLNDLYTCFDATINAYNVYKVETIGDAYMVVGGLPVRIPDHADQIATMALHLLHQSGKFKIRHLPFTPLRLRIGLHTGPCCAGVVGLTMPRYCLFGDTVNTASRLESTGAAWRIHLSQATKEKLDQVGEYEIQYRGETELKGKGKMPTYWLLGKTGFNKELPVPPLLEESHGLDENLIRYGRTGLYETGVSSIEGLRPQIGPRESEESGSVDLSIEFSASQTSPPTTTTSQTTRQSLEAIAAQKILKNQFSLDARLGVGVPLHGGSIRAGTKLEKHRTFDAHLITVTNRDDDEEVSDSTTHAENDLGNVSGVSLNVTNLLRVHSSGLSTPFSISDTEFDLQYIDQASSSASSNTSRNQLEPPTVATISKPHQATENDRSCPQKSPLLRPNLKQNIENPFISITNREYPVISAEEKSKLIEMSRVPEPKDRDSLKTVQDTSLSNNINSFATCINNSNNSNSHSISNNNNINNSSNTFNNNSSRAGLDNVIVQNVHAEPASTCIPGSNNSINNNDCSKIGESSNYKTDNAISSIFRVVNPQKHKQDYDISTPYSHYRCLSPMSETSTEAASHRLSVGMGRLKRQFSVDKTDEIGVVEGLCLSTTGLKTSTGGNQQSSSGNRLFKQNSAGAASDLERIAEEAAAAGASGLPATGNKFTSKDDYYKHRLNVPSLKSISASSESLH